MSNIKLKVMLVGIVAFFLSACASDSRSYEEPAITQPRAKVVFASDDYTKDRSYGHFYVETGNNSIAKFYSGVEFKDIDKIMNNFDIPLPQNLTIYSQIYVPANKQFYFKASGYHQDPELKEKGARNELHPKSWT